jgi:hypothetical protein
LSALSKKKNFGPTRRACAAALTAGFLLFNVISCTLRVSTGEVARRSLQETVALVGEVKEFEATLGIEPTETLTYSSREQPSLSMLWLWLQRVGTLAWRRPIDIRMAIGFYADKERIPLERVYQVAGYSVYYRQGNEFADQRAVTTVGFAEEDIVRRVKVIIHEDLHGDRNFDLPWEIEESIVTPLGALAAVEFFRRKGDDENLRRARAALDDERALSRELVAVAARAETIFAKEPVDDAKRNILSILSEYPIYQRNFQRQTRGQDPATVLEAKLSHDLAYYRYFDAIARLSERAADLKQLIGQLKRFPPNVEAGEAYLRQLGLGDGTATH